MTLSTARALVTGGSSGIGLAVARALRDAGAQVAIVGRTAETLQEAAAEIGAVAVVGDVAADAERIVAEARDALGGLDVLVNNAGAGYIAPLLEVDADAFEAVWRTNVLGATLVAQACARIFVGQEHGHIVNVGSTSALKGSAGMSPYVATKHALKGMTESWRGELRKHNVRVMLVNPSEVMTAFSENMETATGRHEKAYTEAEQATKLRAEDVAHVVTSMLALDDRAFVTEATVFATNPAD